MVGLSIFLAAASWAQDPLRERYWRAETEVSADPLTGVLRATSKTSFVTWYGEGGSAWARVTLLGGGVNRVEETTDNCGPTCAEAQIETWVQALGTSLTASGSHEGYAFSFDYPTWWKTDSSSDWTQIPGPPSVSFSGIYNSDPNYPSFRFTFNGTQPAYASVQAGNATGIGFPSQNAVSLPIDLNQVPVGSSAVSLIWGMYGIYTSPVPVCSIARSGPIPLSQYSYTPVLVGFEPNKPVPALVYASFLHEMTDVVETIEYCQPAYPSLPVRALVSLGSVSSSQLQLSQHITTSESHGFMPAGSYAGLPLVYDGAPPNSNARQNHRINYTNLWLAGGNQGQTCNTSLIVETDDGLFSTSLGCLSVTLP